MLNHKSKFLAFTLFVITASTADAACTPPTGWYSGSGAGPVSLVYNNVTANGTGGTTMSLRLNPVSNNQQSGSWNSQTKLAGIASQGGSIYTNLQDVRNGVVINYSIRNGLPPSRNTVSYFDTVTCTGIMRLSGKVFVAQIGANAVQLGNFTEAWPIDTLFKFSVTNNGSTITLTDYSNMSQNFGYDIRLERQ